MHGTVEGGEPVGVAPSARWQWLADRLARYALLILLGSVAIALVGGAAVAVAWQPPAQEVQVVDACPNPPCFGGGGRPGVQDLPWLIAMLGYALASLLSMPSGLAGAWDALRGRRAVAGRRLLTFFGPVLVFILIEILPHVLNPCGTPYALGRRDLPGFCETSPEWGADVEERYHLLEHALVGGLPMAALYWLALRKWHPAVARLRPAGMRLPYTG